MSSRYWDDPAYREERREYGRWYSEQYRRRARAARLDLDNFRSLDRRLAGVVDSSISVWGAGDGDVTRFYRNLKWRLEYAKRTGKIDW